jgi:hypothetical protein
MTEESSETKLALLNHRVKAIEDKLKSVESWGIKAALGLIGTLVLTYWDRIQQALKALGK